MMSQRLKVIKIGIVFGRTRHYNIGLLNYSRNIYVCVCGGGNLTRNLKEDTGIYDLFIFIL